MNNEQKSEPEFTAEASMDDHRLHPHVYASPFSQSKHFGISGGSFTNVIEAAPSDPPGGTHDQYTNTFFPNSKHLVITGGNFTNINQAAPSSAPDFRVIPLGDLNLLHPIGPSSGSAVVSRRRKRATVRRMYSAQIHGSRSNMTAAVYQGDGAEEQWRAGISRYADIRHPYLFQLYGIASTGGLYAAVFHDDLIPHGEILEKYRGAHFPTVFFWACIDAQFCDVNQYVSSFSGRNLEWAEYMVWIRPSTTQLCVELMAPAHDYLELSSFEYGIRPSEVSFSQIPEDSHIMASLSLQAYHEICYFHLAQRQYFPISTNDSVQLGSIRHFPGPEYENSFKIAFVPNVVVEVDDRGWETEDHMVDALWNPLNGDEAGTSILENGWIRVNSANVVDEYQRRVYTDFSSSAAWLAQADRIFNSLGIKSNLDEYVFVDGIQCRLRLLGPLDNLPPGYLFLCPLTEFQTELPGHCGIPACAAYWSRDPSGAERLSAEEAKNAGFPDIEFCMWSWGRAWDDGVYTGIRQFHQAKGFGPYSQEVAIELGYPLLQVSCEQDDLFANLQESDTEDDYSDSNEDGDFWHSEDNKYEPDALPDTTLAGDTEINSYEDEDFLSNLHQTEEKYAVTPSQTISLGQTTTGCPLASIQLTDDRQKRAHPAAFQSDRQPPSSKRARFLPPCPLRSEAPNFGEDSPVSFASSSRVTLDDLRSSNNTQRPASLLGELDHLVDPLHDLNAAEVDAIMILSQLGARS